MPFKTIVIATATATAVALSMITSPSSPLSARSPIPHDTPSADVATSATILTPSLPFPRVAIDPIVYSSHTHRYSHAAIGHKVEFPSQTLTRDHKSTLYVSWRWLGNLVEFWKD
ncbi:hypothetical protein BDQ12DRAFT_679395 [Crucibulum laeve]|uniref:Uncharacterized protein n=1 Tax=Crucibulum laeve TaxID=68775 RepID=A0A5C3M9P9_9AGAR|nr:hypothetical protein BDQ12DRAFT_679395 [Crucibulum laeve]